MAWPARDARPPHAHPPKQVGQERDDGQQDASDRHQSPPHPADSGRERDVGSQDVRRRLHAPRGLDGGHHGLQRLKGVGKPTGEAVGQQTEGLMRRGTVVPRDAHPRRGAPRIRAVTHEAAAAARMAGTRGEACLTPGTARNIGLAGEQARVTQLHRPGDARWLPWRPPLLLAIADDGDCASITGPRRGSPAPPVSDAPEHLSLSRGALGGIHTPAPVLWRTPPSACTTPPRSASASHTALSDRRFPHREIPRRSVRGIAGPVRPPDRRRSSCLSGLCQRSDTVRACLRRQEMTASTLMVSRGRMTMKITRNPVIGYNRSAWIRGRMTTG